MAHEKLSPRQKMIGMMYLVLTAMLALNVSKEAVEAFKKVDKGLTTTIANYIKKNETIYAEFDRSLAEFPEKTGPYHRKAYRVKERTDEIFDYIQQLKIEIINTAEGIPNPAVRGNLVIVDSVSKIDDNNVPSEILIGANEDGKAYWLKTMINDYRDSLIAMIEGENTPMEAALRASLNTDDGHDPSGQPERWENNTFHSLPLVAVIALLSKMQVDIRNAETEILNYLYDQIDKATFKFDKVSAVVIPKSTYVTLGSSYEASVFLSATDSRQLPPVIVDGRQLDYDEEGRGVYSVRPSTVGVKKWGGVISLKAPDGTVKPYPFESEYVVDVANVNVNPTAVNIMYTQIANPIDVSVPGVRPDKIKIKVNGGTFSTEKVKNSKGEPYRGNWAVTPTVEAGKVVQVVVTAEDANGKQVTYPPYEFRVKNIPKPESQFAGKNSGPVPIGTLRASDQLFAVLKDFEFDLTYTVTEFTMAFVDRFGLAERSATGSRLTQEQKDIIGRLTRGQTLTFYNIKARSPYGKIEELSPIVLKVD